MFHEIVWFLVMDWLRLPIGCDCVALTVGL